MSRRSKLRLVSLLCAACICVAAAWAAGQSTKLAEYRRLAWLVGNDGLNGDPYSLAQGGDGYLWVGTSSGLFRFDGGRFKSWPEDQSGPRLADMILSLYHARDGSVWAAGEGVLYHISGQKVESYRPPNQMTFILGITEGAEGGILFGGKDVQSGRWQLCSLRVGGAMHCDAIADDGRASWIGQHAILYVDGTTWVGVDTGLVPFRGAEKLTIPLPALASNVNHYGVSALASDGHDGVLVGVIRAGPGLGLQHVIGDKVYPLEVPSPDMSTLHVTSMVRDTNDALWIGTADKGIYRVSGTQTEHFDTPEGLPGKYVYDLREDYEGSMWVSTRGGVTRFSKSVIVSVPNDRDFHSDEVDGVEVASDGTLWVTGRETLQSLRPGASRFTTPTNVSGRHIGSILQDHRGTVWLGLDNSLARLLSNGRFSRVDSPDGSSFGQISSLAEDSDFNIWVIAEGPPPRTFTISPDRMHVTLISNLPPTSQVVADRDGGVFLATLRGDIIHIDGKGYRTQFRPQTTNSIVIRHLSMQPDGTLLAATNRGLFVLKNGIGHLLDVQNGMPCNDHENALFDHEGNLWIYMQCGLARITKADLMKWERDHVAVISASLFDVEDGALPARSPWNGAGITPDGTLWYAAGNRLQKVSPDSIRGIRAPPVVKIEELIADRRYFPLDRTILLAPLTRDIQINYAALSFVSPDKVQFRYKLDGFDRDWKDAGGRRQALYTGLPPGQYRFHVTSRKSSVEPWNPQEQVIDFELGYALYQTAFFKVICVAAVALMLFVIAQLRVKSVARNVRMRQAVEHAERERIARELHDTFLQSVQGLFLKFSSVSKNMPKESALRETMEELLDLSDDVIGEARSSIDNLRERQRNTLRLPEKVALLAEQLCGADGTRVNVFVHGEPYHLASEMYDHIYSIAQEAIRNAGKHSCARNVEVELDYRGDTFRLAIRDDGGGIDDKTLGHGRPRHWGLLGMRERAKLINGCLNILSRVGGGTEVELAVPRLSLAAGQIR